MKTVIDLQGTREMMRKHVDEFGDLIRKDNDVALIIDGQVGGLLAFSLNIFYSN